MATRSAILPDARQVHALYACRLQREGRWQRRLRRATADTRCWSTIDLLFAARLPTFGQSELVISTVAYGHKKVQLRQNFRLV